MELAVVAWFCAKIIKKCKVIVIKLMLFLVYLTRSAKKKQAFSFMGVMNETFSLPGRCIVAIIPHNASVLSNPAHNKGL